MKRYLAKSMGTLPSGRRVREGGEIREEELDGAAPGLWMELVEDCASPAPPQAPEPEANTEDKSETAGEAEPKARKRKGAE